MAEAAERDRIARQYVTAYDDVFSLGLPALETARQRHSDARWSTLAVYLTFLAAMPDTHIVRKFDLGVAEAVRREAVRLARRVRGGSQPGGDRRQLTGLGRGAEIARDQSRDERGSHRGDFVCVEPLAPSATTNALPPSCPYALTMLELGLRGARAPDYPANRSRCRGVLTTRIASRPGLKCPEANVVWLDLGRNWHG